MKPSIRRVFGLALLLLFLIQASGTLVESIYILDLMHTSLDVRALGVLFFFAPLGWLFFRRWPGTWSARGLALVLALGRVLIPYLSTTGRLVSAGLAVACGWSLLAWWWGAVHLPEDAEATAVWGVALGTGLSGLLRTVNAGVDASLMPYGGWLGGLLGLAFLALMWSPERHSPQVTLNSQGVKSAAAGGVLVVAMLWFAFASPAVIARWLDLSYPAVVLVVGGWCALWPILASRLRFRLPRSWLVVWNVLFGLALTGGLWLARLPFPSRPTMPPLVVSQPDPVAQGLLWLALLLMPVLFEDFGRFSGHLSAGYRPPRTVAGGMLLALLLTVVLVFIHVFTNVWGYVEPVSRPFRNHFWLPFGLLSLALTLAVLRAGTAPTRDKKTSPAAGLSPVAGLLWIGLALGVVFTTPSPPPIQAGDSLRVMTYNIQAGNNDAGERDFDAQVALIRRLNPDLIALQESDTPRLSLNNHDLVRYFAHRLGYYVVYGPPTVAGTFGTALLSRFPLQNPRVIYTFSDQDEIGTTVAEFDFGGQTVTVANVHPDGSKTAMLVFADTLVAQLGPRSPLIVLGDFNLREGDPAYETIAALWQNAWLARYPTGIRPDGLDMSGRQRIDHIFVDEAWKVLDADYILPPDSHTDHPVHWADLALIAP